MKNLFFLLLMFVFSSTLMAQPNDMYIKGMGKAFELWGAGQTNEAVAMFERITQAEKTNWIPAYYAANVLISQSFQTQDKSLINEMLEKAKGHIATCHERSPDNSEVVTLEGLLYTGYVAMDPQTNGMTMSPMIMQLHSKAIELDNTNPRAHSNLVEYEIGGAQFFGTDLKTFCTRIKEIMPMYADQKEGQFLPKWGLERMQQSYKDCGCEEPTNEEAVPTEEAAPTEKDDK